MEIKLDVSHTLLAGALYNPSAYQILSSLSVGTQQENYFGGSLGFKFGGRSLSGTIGGFCYIFQGNILQSGNSLSVGSVRNQLFGILASISSNL